MIQRFLPWLKEFKPEAYDDYRFNEDGDRGDHPEPMHGDKFWECEIEDTPALIFQSAREEGSSEEFWEWNGNNKSWQRMSDEDIPDELLR